MGTHFHIWWLDNLCTLTAILKLHVSFEFYLHFNFYIHYFLVFIDIGCTKSDKIIFFIYFIIDDNILWQLSELLVLTNRITWMSQCYSVWNFQNWFSKVPSQLHKWTETKQIEMYFGRQNLKFKPEIVIMQYEVHVKWLFLCNYH